MQIFDVDGNKGEITCLDLQNSVEIMLCILMPILNIAQSQLVKYLWWLHQDFVKSLLSLLLAKVQVLYEVAWQSGQRAEADHMMHPIG